MVRRTVDWRRTDGKQAQKIFHRHQHRILQGLRNLHPGLSQEVLALDDRQKAFANAPEQCTGCLNCEIYCPDFAIDVSELEEVSLHV